MGLANHSWNAVKLNNSWYLLDATLASGYFDVNAYKFVKNYNDGYFLANPELFIKSHFPLDARWMLLEEAVSADVFTNGPIIYGNTLKHSIVPIYPSTLRFEVFKDETIQFKLKTLKDVNLDELTLAVSNGLNTDEIGKARLMYENDLLTFDYKFKISGHYDIHLKLNEDIVASYTVEVSRSKKNAIETVSLVSFE